MNTTALTEVRNPLNRNDVLGKFLSAVVPLVLVVVVNAFLLSTGATVKDTAFMSLRFAPPAWLVAVVWMAIYPMWGYARWLAYQAGPKGRRDSLWCVGLIAWGLAYPIVSYALDVQWNTGANVVSLVLALVAGWRLSKVSKPAAFWVLPSIVWMAFACFLGFAALVKATVRQIAAA